MVKLRDDESVENMYQTSFQGCLEYLDDPRVRHHLPFPTPSATRFSRTPSANSIEHDQMTLAARSGGLLRPALTSSLPARISHISKATFLTSSYCFNSSITSSSNTQQKLSLRPRSTTHLQSIRKMSQKSMTSRIAILGSGEVGSTIAY